MPIAVEQALTKAEIPVVEMLSCHLDAASGEIVIAP
tara:strand:- start:583 stop:690 length:108 start_codon:yes stop_codon:yes gene_type:complete